MWLIENMVNCNTKRNKTILYFGQPEVQVVLCFVHNGELYLSKFKPTVVKLYVHIIVAYHM